MNLKNNQAVWQAKSGNCKINIDFNNRFLRQLAVTEDQLINFIQQDIHTKFTLIKLYLELNDSSALADASAELLLYVLFNPVLSMKTGE